MIRHLARAGRLALRFVEAAATFRLVAFFRTWKYALLIRRSGLFQAEHYLAQLPDPGGARGDPIWHFLVEGARRGLDPNPFFDTSYYAERCRESLAGGKNPLVHFIRSGGTGGPSPSPRFDASYYVSRYPDVRGSGMNPLAHYLSRGASEGRACVPGAITRPPELDPSAAVPFDFAPAPGRAPSLAVACHLFHADLAGDLERYLRNIPFPFHLFVTTDTEAKRAALERRFGALA